MNETKQSLSEGGERKIHVMMNPNKFLLIRKINVLLANFSLTKQPKMVYPPKTTVYTVFSIKPGMIPRVKVKFRVSFIFMVERDGEGWWRS